jgi:low affinity Fe/Cu permease
LIDGNGHVAEHVRRESGWFGRVSRGTRRIAGSPKFSVGVVVAVILWAIAGPLVGFIKTWELLATAGAPIVALLLLVVLQHTQNRDDRALQLKLDEVIRVLDAANDHLISIEDGKERDLSDLQEQYRRHVQRSTIR